MGLGGEEGREGREEVDLKESENEYGKSERGWVQMKVKGISIRRSDYQGAL